ncbi:hypothetical protein HD806DRAFT_546348 [Xylariaceae sp. AK1471]|nr:hypothetical protein HD806DRAFT_546348 [Xylariaceae sp. AK1471]
MANSVPQSPKSEGLSGEATHQSPKGSEQENQTNLQVESLESQDVAKQEQGTDDLVAENPQRQDVTKQEPDTESTSANARAPDDSQEEPEADLEAANAHVHQNSQQETKTKSDTGTSRAHGNSDPKPETEAAAQKGPSKKKQKVEYELRKVVPGGSVPAQFTCVNCKELVQQINNHPEACTWHPSSVAPRLISTVVTKDGCEENYKDMYSCCFRAPGAPGCKVSFHQHEEGCFGHSTDVLVPKNST